MSHLNTSKKCWRSFRYGSLTLMMSPLLSLPTASERTDDTHHPTHHQSHVWRHVKNKENKSKLAPNKQNKWTTFGMTRRPCRRLQQDCLAHSSQKWKLLDKKSNKNNVQNEKNGQSGNANQANKNRKQEKKGEVGGRNTVLENSSSSNAPRD